jgi:hypothetical protein
MASSVGELAPALLAKFFLATTRRRTTHRKFAGWNK